MNVGTKSRHRNSNATLFLQPDSPTPNSWTLMLQTRDEVVSCMLVYMFYNIRLRHRVGNLKKPNTHYFPDAKTISISFFIFTLTCA